MSSLQRRRSTLAVQRQSKTRPSMSKGKKSRKKSLAKAINSFSLKAMDARDEITDHQLSSGARSRSINLPSGRESSSYTKAPSESEELKLTPSDSDSVRSDTNTLDHMEPKRLPRRSIKVLDEGERKRNLALVEVFGKEPCLYSHKAYRVASFILNDIARARAQEDVTSAGSSDTEIVEDSKMKLEIIEPQGQRRSKSSARGSTDLKSPDISQELPTPTISSIPTSRPQMKSATEKRLCYQLAITCYKYIDVVTSVLENAFFFMHHPEYREMRSLVYVIFFDYLSRKFQKRISSENEIVELECTDIENSLHDLTIRLQASYARHRIKHEALRLDSMLAPAYREIDETVAETPLWIWVNQIVTNIEEVARQLVNIGLDEDNGAKKDEAPPVDKFYRDIHADDVIVINRENRNLVRKSWLFRDNQIIFHDKAQSIAITTFLQKCTTDDSIAIINPVSIWFAFHVESRLYGKYGSQMKEKGKFIHVFVEKTKSHGKDKDQRIIRAAGSSAIQVHLGNPVALNPKDDKWIPITMGIFMLSNTMSGVIDPIEFLINEHSADQNMINNCLDMSPDRPRPTNIADHLQRNLSYIKIFGQFPHLRFIVCFNNSIFKEENEKLTNQMLDAINKVAKAGPDNKKPFVLGEFPENLTLTKFLQMRKTMLEMTPSIEGNGFYMTIYQKSYMSSMSTTHRMRRASKTESVAESTRS